MFGLHPNAEIGYLTLQTETLFSTIQSVSGGGAGGGGSDAVVKEMINTILSTLPPDFVMLDITSKAKYKTPYVNVCLQEVERMNILLAEIRTSLLDLEAGLAGKLNVTDAMDELANALALNQVPATWTKYAYMSKKSLVDWFSDMKDRVTQLAEWSENL